MPRSTTAMMQGRRADSERRRQRVLEAVRLSEQRGQELTATSIARKAKVDRTFLYRHRDLLQIIHAAQQEPTATAGTAPEASKASLRADLLNARERAERLNRRVLQLEKKLSAVLGQQVWQAAGSGTHPEHDLDTLRRRVASLEQECADLRLQLEERTEELAAARAANRELMLGLNARS
ncbi:MULTISPECIES: DUF6262 family protein [unclassified Streptomyces]|uniref:DUF6262 family protein n=1 Tax=unclassified Streptomyces TaxID=2593676 RepID=UPI0033F79A19